MNNCIVGRWWNDSSIEVVRIDGRDYALAGWNGEKYCSCWECFDFAGGSFFEASEEEVEIRPVYNGYFDIVGYELC